MSRLSEKARELKQEIMALAMALSHPAVRWHAKALLLLILAYAVSPIDLIPDFIPVLGLLDDLILVPLGIMLLLRLIPQPVMEDCRRRVQARLPSMRYLQWLGVVLIVLIWSGLLFLALWTLG